MPNTPFFFIQFSDPQLGALARVGSATLEEGMAQEVALFEEAIAEVNRLRPDFVVITGDLGG